MPRQHTVLVSCAATKRVSPSAARDLYVSALFAKARRYAERTGDSWYILSALHGLLDPSAVIEPYNCCLNDFRISQRREWAARVNQRLLGLLDPGQEVIILAGKPYREFLVPFLERQGFGVTVPLFGMRIGEQLQWLQAANASGDQPQRGLTMTLGSLTSRAAVLQAIAEFDSLGQSAFLGKYGFGPAHRYFIVHNDRLYDSKAIAGVGYGYQFPAQGPLQAGDFSGGDRTVREKLEELGFEVKVLPDPRATARRLSNDH